MLGFVIPPLIECRLRSANTSLSAAFNPRALIDILLPEDVAYYIYINQVLFNLSKTTGIQGNLCNRVLKTFYTNYPLDQYLKDELRNDEYYMERLNKILSMVPNVPFMLGIAPADFIELDTINSIDQLPCWFKDQLIETTVGSVDNMPRIDTQQCNLFVLEPVDAQYYNIVLISADKTKTDQGEFILRAVDHSIERVLRYHSFPDIVKTPLFGLFTQLSATYRLI